MPDEDRKAAHRAWLESFGFSANDWSRIKAQAVRVSNGGREAGLDDLDAPWRVQAVPLDERRWQSGTMLGVYAGCALLAWRQ